MAHPSPLCPVHGTDEVLIGCPCNDWDGSVVQAATAADLAYVRHVVMFEAVCTCGWKQLHALKANAEYDASEHQRNGRHQ